MASEGTPTVAHAREAGSFLLKDIVKFRIYFEGNDNDSIEFLVHRDDVAIFMEAQVKLHYEPGINPHSGSKTKRATAMSVCNLALLDSAWWAAPSLGVGIRNQPAEIRARVITETGFEYVWESPEEAMASDGQSLDVLD